MNVNTKTTMSGKGKAFGVGFLSLVVLFITILGVNAQSVKITIKDTGFYRVTKAQIADVLNMSESQVESTPLTVFNLGKEVSSVRENGDVVFFGHAYLTRFTDQNVYMIEIDQPSVIDQVLVNAGNTPFADSFATTKKTEQQLLIRADLVKNTNNPDEDPIFWRMLTSGLSTRFYNAPVSLDAVKAGTGGSLTVRLKGATEVLPGRYYHRARIDLNGTTLGFIDFEGLQNIESTFSVPSGLLNSGNNTVRVESTPPSGTSLDSFYLDYIVVNYTRTLAVALNRLTFSANQGSALLTGFTGSNIRLWDVSDNWMAKVLSGQQAVLNGSTWDLSFEAPTSGKYAACLIGSELAPLVVEAGNVVDLRSTDWELDHITISHPILYTAAESIKSYRASKGMLSEIISINDVYDSFNYGIRDPRAIQTFLSYAYRNWSRSPRYVLLVGDGSLDYRNDLGFNDSLIPSTPIVVPTGLYASDYLFGDPTGTGKVEIAVGRIPVKTTNDVSSYVQKMINYEMGGNWRTNTLISTDQSDFAGNFYGDGNDLEQIISDREVIRADIDIIGASATRETLIAGVNAGKEMSFYIGHGTPNQLSQQSILLTQDALAFTNDVSPTAFVMLGCLVGTFGGPGVTSLGEGLMLAKGGSASLTAAATLISAADGKVISERMLESIYDEGDARIGDAWIKGKNRLMYFGLYPAYAGFQLMGDPALAIGSADTPRPEEGINGGRGTYEEWQNWHLPPVLQDLGYTMDPEDDPDEDLFDNFSEYMAGTDPHDSGSFLEVFNLKRLSNGQLQISWPSVNGRSYDVEAAGNINGPYTLVAENVEANWPENFIQFSDGSNLRYFRVKVK